MTPSDTKLTKRYWLLIMFVILIGWSNFDLYCFRHPEIDIAVIDRWLKSGDSIFWRYLDIIYLNILWFMVLFGGLALFFWGIPSARRRLFIMIFYPIQLVIYFINIGGNRGELLASAVFLGSWLLVGLVMSITYSIKPATSDIKKSDQGMNRNELY